MSQNGTALAGIIKLRLVSDVKDSFEQICFATTV
jgi:hypothetical protein